MKIAKINTFLLMLILATQGYYLYRQQATRPRTPEPVRAAAAGTVIDVKGMPSLGGASARGVLIEFSDYQCPFCQRHANGVWKEVKARFIDTGKARFYFANNPLPMHQNARAMAKAAICAGRQDRYWQLHDAMFKSPPKTHDEILSLAAATNLAREGFDNCVANDKEADRQIDADMAYARDLGLQSTPAFAVGILRPDGRVDVRQFIRGAQPIEIFDAVIRTMI